MDTPNFLRNACDSVDRYTELWKEEHDQAMACLDFEELMAFGVSVGELIDRVERIWRSNVQKNPTIYREAIDEQIECLYRRWLEPGHRILERMQWFEQQFELTGADEFRAACVNVQYTVKLFEGLRLGNRQLDRGERIPFAEVQKLVNLS